jgi:hypothetical protein
MTNPAQRLTTELRCVERRMWCRSRVHASDRTTGPCADPDTRAWCSWPFRASKSHRDFFGGSKGFFDARIRAPDQLGSTTNRLSAPFKRVGDESQGDTNVLRTWSFVTE